MTARAVGVPRGVDGRELGKLEEGGAGGFEVEDQKRRVGRRRREAGTGAAPRVAIEKGAGRAVGSEGGEFDEEHVVAGGGAGGARGEGGAETGAERFAAEAAGGVTGEGEARAGGEAAGFGEGQGGARDGDGSGDVGGGGVVVGGRRGQAGE